MALSQQVEESLKDAESNLRNALAFAARNEKPFVNVVIASLIKEINQVIDIDKFMDKLESQADKFNFDK
ncbi:hypothetical protein EBS02_07310 [bacterium]|nr:hypothetical protein [bacterium]